ncbi:Trans-1,2-dihydrobenzene-1,2-diol dehydrogenase-like [Aphelenchoides bicaudatus]|nr:Trans-1,2-dihydrobenzene-1,2-diol dehydrogenase-like [Aphelenchoides bicaudatus]
MPEEKLLRWGTIGAGKIAHDFVQAMDKTEHNHKTVAVSASSKQRAQELVDKLKLDAKAYGSYEDVINDPDVDIVYIGLHNEAHVPWIKKALEGGKHVLSEKPIGVNLREATEAFELAKQKKLFLMEAFWSRFFPVWRHLKRLIDSKELGEAKIASANFGYPHDDHWRCLERGESPLTLYALYTVMFSHFVFGRKAKNIIATGRKDSFGTDNWASLVLEFDDDKRAVLYYDSLTYLPQSAFIPEFFWCPEKLLVIRGEMVADNKEKKLYEYPLNDERNHSSGLRYETDHVYELLQQGKLESDIMSHQDTLDVMGMLDEIRRQLGVVFPHDK